ncbi:hypothetical protein PUR61_21375, partial [Streptomyces sp. BE20]|nr:hypothetical protein [Streptomyces sp. BE20]
MGGRPTRHTTPPPHPHTPPSAKKLHPPHHHRRRIANDALPSPTHPAATTQICFTRGTGWFYTKEDYKEIVSYASSRFMT